MSNTVSITYARKFTNKLGDGSFESFELGGSAEVGLDDSESLTETYDQLYSQFVSDVEGKVLELAGSLNTAPTPAAAPAASSGSGWGPSKSESEESKGSWIDKSIKGETEKIQSGIAKQTLPGERFSKPPTAPADDEPVDLGIEEGQAATFMNVKAFLDNKGTKVAPMNKGGEYAMIRIGERGVIPGDYITAKSFEPSVVSEMKSIINRKIQRVDVYGQYRARSNDPDVFDLIVEGIRPTES